jgi:hypothetical protein
LTLLSDPKPGVSDTTVVYAWAPGAQPLIYPEGVAGKIDGGSRLVLHVLRLAARLLLRRGRGERAGVPSGRPAAMRGTYDNSMDSPYVARALREEGLGAPHDVFL